MLTDTEREEYLTEIRRQVCSFCKEKADGGPPCTPLGKPCGVELYLDELIDAVHEVHDEAIEPYRQSKEKHVCSRCAYLHSTSCPCPLDLWFAPVIQAIETVDRRRQERVRGHQFVAALPRTSKADLSEANQTYERAVGQWTGCDWPTRFGNTDIDLEGWTAEEAESMAVESADAEEVEDWTAAAEWLAQVEQNAALAESQAALALAAAHAGEWGEALEHARRAVLLEFAAGRPLWHGLPLTWQPLFNAIKDAALHSAGEPKAQASSPSQA
jgi:hypothetical protein